MRLAPIMATVLLRSTDTPGNCRVRELSQSEKGQKSSRTRTLLIDFRRTYRMGIESLASVERPWSRAASVWRLVVAILLVMQGTAGVALAQSPESYIVRFRE